MNEETIALLSSDEHKKLERFIHWPVNHGHVYFFVF